MYNYTQALLYSSKVNETTSGNFASENETSGNFQTGTAYILVYISCSIYVHADKYNRCIDVDSKYKINKHRS